MTFLDYVNLVLNEVNEVPLTSSQLDSARGLHLYAKNAVNRAYLDIVNTPEAKWPWLQAQDQQQTQAILSGINKLPTIFDQELYEIPLTDPYKDLVDWDNIYLTDEAGNRLDIGILSWPEYQDYLERRSTEGLKGEPSLIYQSADGRSIGIHPVPSDKTYNINYRAWERPARFTSAVTVVPLPEQFSNVLVDGASHYVWRFRENIDQATFSFQKFERGVKDMKRVYGNQSIQRLRWR